MRKSRLGTIVTCCVLIGAAAALVFALHRRAIWSPPPVGPPEPVVSLSLTGATPTLAELRAGLAGRNVVICVLDAARADHLPCYGYPRNSAPYIDRLADESLIFDRHFTQYTQTKASTVSLFTGQYPPTHGAYRERPLDDSAFTLAGGLKAGGYHTAFFSSNMWLMPSRGAAVGFEHMRSVSRGGPGSGRGGAGADLGTVRMERKPEHLLEQFRLWLESRPPEPFFAYLHFLPPHSPYGDPAEAKRLFKGDAPAKFWRGRLPFPEIEDAGSPKPHESPGTKLINLYDANMRKADWAVQQVCEMLMAAGVFEDTLFIVTADHGETFGEHGYGWHPQCPYEESIRIPLLMRFPGEAEPRGRVGALTQAIDVLPTVFELLDLPYPQDSVQGRSLLPLLTGEVEEINEYVFSQTEGRPPCYVVRDRRFSLLLYEGGTLRALYDLESDPWQTHNVIDELPEEASRLAEVFRGFAVEQRRQPLDYLDPDAPKSQPPPRAASAWTEEERKELEALGYLR
jgi:arylsulfatase